MIMNDFLETEIHGEHSINAFLGAVQGYKKNGDDQIFEITGNAYNVTIKKTCVVIENIWDESLPVIEMTVDDYIQAIENFIAR